MSDKHRIFSPEEAAAEVKVSLPTLRGYYRDGRLPVVRIRGSRLIRIREDDLIRIFEPYPRQKPDNTE